MRAPDPPSFARSSVLLAARVRELRSERDLSQEQLALAADVDRTYVSQIERDAGNPSLRVLCKLADALGVPLCALICTERAG